ncbi:MAG TPA: cytochrome c oxidase assembly protein [Xanthobacteraceae bacterium]|jgi:cytochrome c oxidase assembly protein subunit 11|nr:cytochrome c oxidase assembly protein [Xanthobacteraceae bacterium]
MTVPSTSSPQRRDVLVAAACGVLVAAMVGAAYAAVPLYNWFCRTTGFGGTPQVATATPSEALDRKLKVRFDANVAGGLPWRFEPERNSVEVKIGEVVTVSYRVVNESARETVGVASYNVSPPTTGAYFSKINCFCFTDQRLKPGEKRDMAVVFFVAPELVKDSEQDGLDTITLSYTMYPARQAEPSRIENGIAPAAGRS